MGHSNNSFLREIRENYSKPQTEDRVSSGYRPASIVVMAPNLVGDPAAEVTPGKLGDYLEGAGFALLVSTYSVAIVLSGGRGLRSAGGRDD